MNPFDGTISFGVNDKPFKEAFRDPRLRKTEKLGVAFYIGYWPIGFSPSFSFEK